LVSDIPVNTEVGLPKECYFKVGNVEDLSHKLSASMSASGSLDYAAWLEKYNWNIIAEQTAGVYQIIAAK
jgi:starch synthase